MKAQRPPAASLPQTQHLELFEDTEHDPYQMRGKLSEPSVCTDCGAVYDEGRWQWTGSPAHAQRVRCAACKRVHDKLAAGYVLIEGELASADIDELRQLIRNLEARAKLENPMQRIIGIEERADGLFITTTDTELAKSIGETLHDTYRGNLDFHYNETGYLLRVRWQRWL
jgi:NMD protein affecting ribosome stability and mRNA decay